MRKSILLLIVYCFCVFQLSAKGKETLISAEIKGLEIDVVNFDFVENGELNMEFPYHENQLMEFCVDLDDITMLRINAWIYVCLQPGDSIHAKIVYEGRSYKSVEYSGTPSAVAINTVLHKIRQSQVEHGYKKNIPAALVILTEPKSYYAATLEEWNTSKALLDGMKDQISPRVYNYIMSEMDAVFLTNLIKYPYASAGFYKKQFEDCVADGYWDVLNDYKPRGDEASLRNQGYMAFLLTFRDYMRSKEAGNKPYDSLQKNGLESEYTDLAKFYDGSLRDAALFVLIYNSLAKGGDFDRIESLTKDYLKKYNKNKEYKKILTEVMK